MGPEIRSGLLDRCFVLILIGFDKNMMRYWSALEPSWPIRPR